MIALLMGTISICGIRQCYCFSCIAGSQAGTLPSDVSVLLYISVVAEILHDAFIMV